VDESISKELEQFYEAFIGVYDAARQLEQAYADSAEASKRSLVGGNIGELAKIASEKANAFAEKCQAEVDVAESKVHKIGSDLDKHFVEKIKLS
jgi:hypothetical protein